MQEYQKKFKAPPKRFQPKGITILFEDREILVVDKASGLLTMGAPNDSTPTAYRLLTEYVRKGNSRSKNRIFIVHRLDRDTSGILLFAKTEKAKMTLQEGWKETAKKYYALVHGTMPNASGVIESYLAETKTHKMYSVKSASEGKYAKTGYTVVEENRSTSLLEVELFTGRKNQIRVHCADTENPIVGDKKYGVKEGKRSRLMLHAFSITFAHPFSKKEFTFEARLPTGFRR